jgi:hypothetical protein
MNYFRVVSSAFQSTARSVPDLQTEAAVRLFSKSDRDCYFEHKVRITPDVLRVLSLMSADVRASTPESVLLMNADFRFDLLLTFPSVKRPNQPRIERSVPSSGPSPVSSLRALRRHRRPAPDRVKACVTRQWSAVNFPLIIAREWIRDCLTSP